MGEDKVEAKGGGLTVAKVKTAKPGKYHDGAGTGLFLRVDPNGGRFWIQRVVQRVAIKIHQPEHNNG